MPAVIRYTQPFTTEDSDSVIMHFVIGDNVAVNTFLELLMLAILQFSIDVEYNISRSLIIN